MAAYEARLFRRVVAHTPRLRNPRVCSGLKRQHSTDLRPERCGHFGAGRETRALMEPVTPPRRPTRRVLAPLAVGLTVVAALLGTVAIKNGALNRDSSDVAKHQVLVDFR